MGKIEILPLKFQNDELMNSKIRNKTVGQSRNHDPLIIFKPI